MTYPKAMDLTKFFEGCKYKAYADSGGIWTIGIGSTKNVTEGMIISHNEVLRRWDVDIQDSITRVNQYLKVQLNDDEMSAVISQAFNLKSFPKLMGHLNRDKELYKNKMLLYCKDAKGNFLKGLLIRRMAERLLFESRAWMEFAVWAQGKTITIDMILDKQKQLFAGV